MLNAPTPEDAELAAKALKDVLVPTPLIRAPFLEELTGATSVHIKAESFQRTGSFKFRGSFWRCMQLSCEERTRGVVAYSSGNFAQGLAAAAQILSVPCTMVMPIDAPETKRQKTEALDATVYQSKHGSQPREEVAAELAQRISREDGLVLLHPFDDPAIVAGHASLAIEILDELVARQMPIPDDVLCCTGGGGLTAGIALGLDARQSLARVVPVEPRGFDSFGASLRAGKPVRTASDQSTICDALQATKPGEVPFSVAQAVGVGDPITVSDDEVRIAMRLALQELKVVTEPSGAVALAALMSFSERFIGRNVVVVLTGGNVELDKLARLVA